MSWQRLNRPLVSRDSAQLVQSLVGERFMIATLRREWDCGTEVGHTGRGAGLAPSLRHHRLDLHQYRSVLV